MRAAALSFPLPLVDGRSPSPARVPLFVPFLAAMELRVGRKFRLGKKIGSGSFGGAYSLLTAPRAVLAAVGRLPSPSSFCPFPHVVPLFRRAQTSTSARM